MPKLHAILLSLAVVFAGSTASAQTSAPAPSPDASAEAALVMRSRLMYLKIGLTEGISVHQAGHPMELGFFGGNAEQFFGEVPDALAAARSYRTKKIVGFTLSGVGLAAMFCALPFMGMSADEQGRLSGPDANVAGGLFFGGALAALAGAFVVQSATSTLTEAINKYNAGILNQFLPPGQKIDLDLVATAQHQGLQLRYTF